MASSSSETSIETAAPDEFVAARVVGVHTVGTDHHGDLVPAPGMEAEGSSGVVDGIGGMTHDGHDLEAFFHGGPPGGGTFLSPLFVPYTLRRTES